MCPHGDPDTVGDVIADKPPSWLAGLLAQRRPLVMGILNVTPDCFPTAATLSIRNRPSNRPSA